MRIIAEFKTVARFGPRHDLKTRATTIEVKEDEVIITPFGEDSIAIPRTDLEKALRADAAEDDVFKEVMTGDVFKEVK